MSTVEHMFPTANGPKRWSVDIAAAARSAGITVERMTREANEMAKHFPRWLLVLVREGQPLQCKCDGLYIFDRGARCVLCDKPPKDTRSHAGWFGVLPPIGIDSLSKIRDQIVKKPPRRHVIGARDPLGTYMLVPLVVQYPHSYPK